MAGWSTFTDGSSLDCLETVVGAYHDNGCCLTLDHLVKYQVDNAANQKCLFYQLFSFYLKDSYSTSRGFIRHVPVLLGDGHSLDLYQLFSFVKERCGYAVVSKNGLWGCVSMELGFNLQVLAAVKLVYDKYLNEFEGWLKKTYGGKNFINENHGCNWGSKSLPLELEKEFRGLLRPNLKWKDDGLFLFESNKIRKYIEVVSHKGEADLLDTKNQNTICEDVKNVQGDDDEKSCNGVKDDIAALDAEVAKKESNSRKRKWEALSGMLNWMRDTAKHPLDPFIQPIPKPSKWKECKGQDYWDQILRAREERLLKRCVEPNSGPSSLQHADDEVYECNMVCYEDNCWDSKAYSRVVAWMINE